MLCIDFHAFYTWEGWGFVAAIGALAAAVATVWYTALTGKILGTSKKGIELTKNSLELTKDSLALTKKSLDLNKNAILQSNKIAEFEIYMRIAEKLNEDIGHYIKDACAKNTLSIDGNINDSAYYNTTGSDFRRYLLDPLEDLAKFYEDGLISLDSVNSGFGSLILIIGNCTGVINYIKTIRLKNLNTYKGVEKLYDKIYKNCTPNEQIGYKPNFI